MAVNLPTTMLGPVNNEQQGGFTIASSFASKTAVQNLMAGVVSEKLVADGLLETFKRASPIRFVSTTSSSSQLSELGPFPETGFAGFVPLTNGVVQKLEVLGVTDESMTELSVRTFMSYFFLGGNRNLSTFAKSALVLYWVTKAGSDTEKSKAAYAVGPMLEASTPLAGPLTAWRSLLAGRGDFLAKLLHGRQICPLRSSSGHSTARLVVTSRRKIPDADKRADEKYLRECAPRMGFFDRGVVPTNFYCLAATVKHRAFSRSEIDAVLERHTADGTLTSFSSAFFDRIVPTRPSSVSMFDKEKLGSLTSKGISDLLGKAWIKWLEALTAMHRSIREMPAVDRRNTPYSIQPVFAITVGAPATNLAPETIVLTSCEKAVSVHNGKRRLESPIKDILREVVLDLFGLENDLVFCVNVYAQMTFNVEFNGQTYYRSGSILESMSANRITIPAVVTENREADFVTDMRDPRDYECWGDTASRVHLQTSLFSIQHFQPNGAAITAGRTAKDLLKDLLESQD